MLLLSRTEELSQRGTLYVALSRSEIMKRYARAHPERIAARGRAWRDAHRKEIAAYGKRRYDAKRTAVDAARDKPCMDCKKRYPPYIMDFDHRDPTKKSFLVSHGMRGIPLLRVLAEIEKCDVVCSNCHRERTWGKPNYHNSR